MNDPNVLKLTDFFKNDVGVRVKNSILHILNDCLENRPSTMAIEGNINKIGF